ncbi:MAG TPA: hypothetical protein VLU25_22565 [Acidobacteriota bacterium]|nr:hypothetical protein [Acidobacteriota bacterium]
MMADESVQSQRPDVVLTQEEWSRVNDGVSNLHSVLHGCPGLDAERKIDLLGPILKQLSSATAPINERLSDVEGGEHEFTN